MSLLTLLDKNLSHTVTPGQWFDSMSLVLPACQVSCILFMRQEYNDPFEYADRLTGFSMWKVTAALCLIPLLWLPYVAGLLDSSIYRFTVLSYNLLAYAFLVYDYIRVYRKRFDYEYWNTYYNNFFRYESRARSEFEEELKCDGTGEKEIGSSI